MGDLLPLGAGARKFKGEVIYRSANCRTGVRVPASNARCRCPATGRDHSDTTRMLTGPVPGRQGSI